MNILILSWRDPMHPLAGGAERVTQKYAEFWVKRGHSVWWISGKFPEASKNDEQNGVEYLRVGFALSSVLILNLVLYPIYLLSTIFTAQKLIKQKRVDKVIDEIHGLPLFTPFYAKDKNVLLVCEVAGEIWDRMYPFPINIIGRLMETFCYRLYQSTPIWAISKNTKKDILKINPHAQIEVLPLGIDIKELPEEEKNSYPSAVFIARLVKMKGVEIALEAAKLISAKLPDFRLTIIGKGSGKYEDYLKQKIKKDGSDERIRFAGFVSEADKYRLLSQSHFLLHPSYKEGFGLTVLEAGLVKTPAIVKRGSSLDELVEDGVDGFIISSAEEMAEKFIQGYQSKSYKDLSEAAKKKAMRYDWNIILLSSKEKTGIND